MIDNPSDPRERRPRLTGSILVAEKEALARDSLVELFYDEGWRAIAAPNSQAAIEQIDASRDLDVVLVDLVLPANELVIRHAEKVLPKAWRVGMALPPVFYPETLHDGLHGYLLKPLVFDELHRFIVRLMRGPPMR